MQGYHKYVKATCIEHCGLAMPAWGGPLRTPKNWFFERFYIVKSNWKSSSLFFLLFPLASCCRTLPIDILSTIFWSMQEHHLNILSTEFWSMGQIYSMHNLFFFQSQFWTRTIFYLLQDDYILCIYIYIHKYMAPPQHNIKGLKICKNKHCKYQ